MFRRAGNPLNPIGYAPAMYLKASESEAAVDDDVGEIPSMPLVERRCVFLFLLLFFLNFQFTVFTCILCPSPEIKF